jgi:hypothetical protein
VTCWCTIRGTQAFAVPGAFLGTVVGAAVGMVAFFTFMFFSNISVFIQTTGAVITGALVGLVTESLSVWAMSRRDHGTNSTTKHSSTA